MRFVPPLKCCYDINDFVAGTAQSCLSLNHKIAVFSPGYERFIAAVWTTKTINYTHRSCYDRSFLIIFTDEIWIRDFRSTGIQNDAVSGCMGLSEFMMHAGLETGPSLMFVSSFSLKS